MPSPWDDRKRFNDAAQYLDDLGERMLKHLTDYLNSVHGIAHSQRYWRILIGPWLIHYLHAVYDRCVHLTEAFDRYPDLQTIVLDPQSFRVPMDTAEFISFIVEDPYNLQIFSQLLEGMGRPFPSRPLRTNNFSDKNAVERGRWTRVARNWIKTSISIAEETVRRMVGNKWQVAFCEMYLPATLMWRVSWRSGLRVLPLRASKEWSFKSAGPSFDERRNGLATHQTSNEFERLFMQSLPGNFPTLYLESYHAARAEMIRRHSHVPTVIVSANAWYFNEPFKFLAAEAVERGCRLVTVQHGGGYGIFRFSAPELHESRICDRFVVWGWADTHKEASPYRNLPNPKLSSLLTSRSDEIGTQETKVILFVATAHPRYLYRFHSMPVGSQWEEYFEWELRFLAALSDRLRSAILLRAYMHDYGHAVRGRISRRFANLRWDDGQPFYRRLKECRLVVVDNCATTFLESLVANVPSVLFWDTHCWEARDEAEPYFESLREVGILWDSPEAAAKKVAEVYDDPWAWWGSEHVQETRQRFVERYALAREDWADCWVKALKEEVASSQAKAGSKC
jgi:putative transferase (TIGR04331 family)